MHLLRISVSKDARMQRGTALKTLCGLLGDTAAHAVFPETRGPADAVRTAAAYTLLAWRTFAHEGKQCRAIASSPKGATGHGLNLHVHVQVRDHARVDYSALVARMTTPHASKAPETIRESGSWEFPELFAALDAATLVHMGQAYLFDNDIRRLLGAILDPVCCGLWKGVSLVFHDAGTALAQDLEHALSTCLDAGSISCSLIALEMSQANREALARELAEELTGQLEKLTERCGYTAPNTTAIQADYEALAGKIAQVESVLGVELPCLDTQIQTENAIMALA